MSILRRIGSALALIWQISRLSLPERLNRSHKRQLLPSSTPRSLFHQVAKIVFSIGKWVVIIFATLSSLFIAYILFSVVDWSSFRRLPPAPAPIITNDGEDDNSDDKMAVEDDDSLPKKETGPTQLLPTNPLPTENPLLRNPSLQQTAPNFSAGTPFPYPSPKKSPFEVARPGPTAQIPGQALGSRSAQNPVKPVTIEQEKPPNDAWIKGRDEQNYYLPVIKFGRKDASKIVYFVWGADEQSRTIFQTYIDPAIKKLIRNPRKNLKLNMIQIIGSEEYGVADPGSMFFCATNSFEYAGVALGYLRSGGNIKKIYKGAAISTSNLYFNEISDLTLKSAGYTPEKCASNMVFWRQLEFAAIESTVLEKLISSSNKLTLIHNGKRIDLQNNDALRRFAREVR